ncbi:CoA pyrophosphatase [uncultured Roseibium sp.]|uniref:CoA pyrophosphatase n=1 Tax=uncultured Roseibium sp. TaxID=1936171 RepID=UPI003217F0E6
MGYDREKASDPRMNDVPSALAKPGIDVLGDIRKTLRHGAEKPAVRDTGDHILNPTLGPYARWDGPPRDAAVLIPIIEHGNEPTVILTVRTAHLSSHAGQIAFPGGKIDREDNGPAAAALREAEEEIGLEPEAVRPIGELSPYLTGSGFKVIPVVAEVTPGHRLVANPHEVDDVFEVPLSFLMDPVNHLRQSRVSDGQRRFFYAMPFGERYIWGVTAGIIRSLYETVYR